MEVEEAWEQWGRGKSKTPYFPLSPNKIQKNKFLIIMNYSSYSV